jgi:hypothetical protein
MNLQVRELVWCHTVHVTFNLNRSVDFIVEKGVQTHSMLLHNPTFYRSVIKGGQMRVRNLFFIARLFWPEFFTSGTEAYEIAILSVRVSLMTLNQLLYYTYAGRPSKDKQLSMRPFL